MKKVLVVEDDQDIRDLITLHLEDKDCTPTGVGDGKRGLQEALTGNYDLVLLDLMLPGTVGIPLSSIRTNQKLHLLSNPCSRWPVP